jgi:hypothetical protein
MFGMVDWPFLIRMVGVKKYLEAPKLLISAITGKSDVNHVTGLHLKDVGHKLVNPCLFVWLGVGCSAEKVVVGEAVCGGSPIRPFRRRSIDPFGHDLPPSRSYLRFVVSMR